MLDSRSLGPRLFENVVHRQDDHARPTARVSDHGVRLPRAGGAVREDGRVDPAERVHRRGLGREVVDGFGRRVRAEDAVELETLVFMPPLSDGAKGSRGFLEVELDDLFV